MSDLFGLDRLPESDIASLARKILAVYNPPMKNKPDMIDCLYNATTAETLVIGFRTGLSRIAEHLIKRGNLDAAQAARYMQASNNEKQFSAKRFLAECEENGIS